MQALRTQNRLVTMLFAASLLALSVSCSTDKGGGSYHAVGPALDVGSGEPEVGGDPTFGDKDATQEDAGNPGPIEDTGGGGGTITACTTDSDCPVTEPFCSPAKLCFECLDESQCGEGQLCLNGTCKLLVCTPGEKVCNGPAVQTCNDDGTDYELFDCSPGTCSAGQCEGCNPGAIVCQGNDVMQCNDQGTYVLSEQCTAGAQCLNGECLVCYPGQKKCDGKDALECSHSGKSWEVAQTCDDGMVCLGGQCQSLCSADLKFNTNEGCDYWAVDLDNASGEGGIPGADQAQFAIVVTNASSQKATVKIRKSKDAAPEAEETLEPGALHIFNLPPYNVNGTMQGPRAWHMESTAPVIAYQFNPLENVGVFSNDASVLLPSNTWGTEYLAMTRWQTGDSYRGYVTVVAGFADTEVTIKVTAKTKAGGSIPALSPGESYTTTLQPFEVLSIESGASCALAVPKDACGDLTGTSIISSKPVGVFGGHEAAVTGQKCCADHLEMQMLPISAWGKTYVASRSAPRGIEPDYWRVLASKDNTKVVTTPTQAFIPTLNRGQWYEISSKESFVIDATDPVLVGQFLASSQEISASTFPQLCSGTGQAGCPNGHTCVNGACEPIGDPAFMLAVPVEQFRNEYVFLAPNQYLQDFANVIAPYGADVLLDGTSIASKLKPIPNSAYSVAQLPIADGVHTIKSVDESGIGIVVYGYDDDVSYGYPGGMSLKTLNQ